MLSFLCFGLFIFFCDIILLEEGKYGKNQRFTVEIGNQESFGYTCRMI